MPTYHWLALDHTRALSNKIHKQHIQKVGLSGTRDLLKQIPLYGVTTHTIAFLLLSQPVLIASQSEGQSHQLMCKQQSRSAPTGEHLSPTQKTPPENSAQVTRSNEPLGQTGHCYIGHSVKTGRGGRSTNYTETNSERETK